MLANLKHIGYGLRMLISASLAFSYCFSLEAQSGNYWSFANGNGLNFTAFGAIALEDSSHGPGIHASMCDKHGNLALYSDGEIIYDAQHKIIANGQGLFTHKLSRTQSFFVSTDSNLTYLVHYGLDPNSVTFLPFYTVIARESTGEWVVKRKNQQFNYSFPFNMGYYFYPEYKRLNSGEIFMVFRSRSPVKWNISDSVYLYSLGINLADSSLVVNSLGIGLHDQMTKFPHISSIYPEFSRISPNGNYFAEVLLVCLNESENVPFKCGYLLNLYAINSDRSNLMLINSFLIEELSGQLSGQGDFGPDSKTFYWIRNEYVYRLSDFEELSSLKIDTLKVKPHGFSHVTDARLAPDGNLYIGEFLVYASESNMGRASLTKFDLTRDTLIREWYISANSVVIQSMFDFALPLNLYSTAFVKSEVVEIACSDSIILKNLSDSIFTEFVWYLPNGDSLVSNDKEIRIKSTDGGYQNYRLKGWNSTGLLNWHSSAIFVHLNPQIKFTDDHLAGCEFVSYRFIDSTNYHTYADSFLTWKLDFGDGSVQTYSGELSQEIGHVYENSGQYLMKVNLQFGSCQDSFITSIPVHILESARPGLEIIDDGECAPDYIRFANKYKGDIDSVVYAVGSYNNVFSLYHQNEYAIFNTIPGWLRIKEFQYAPTGCVTVDSIDIYVKEGIDVSGNFGFRGASILNNAEILIFWEKISGASSYSVRQLTSNGINKYSRVYSGIDTFCVLHDISQSSSHTFAIEAMDSCNRLVTSGIFSNIALNSTFDNVQGSVRLDWVNILAPDQDYSIWYTDKTIYQKEIGNSQNSSFVSNLDEELRFEPYIFQIVAEYNSTKNIGSKYRVFSNADTLRIPVRIFIPNSFSPNGDGLNDEFCPLIVGKNEVVTYQMKIVNRWGSILYESNSLEDPCWDGNWRGEPAESAVYFILYSVKYKEIDGRIQTINSNNTLLLLR